MTKHHPSARRVHREGHDEDVFVTGVLESGVWAKNHGRNLLIAGIATLVLVAGILYYRNWRASLNDRAAAELTTVRQTMLQGNRELAVRDLKQFVTKYGSASSVDEARLMLAQAYLESGQPLPAIEAVKPIAGDPAKASGATAALIMGAAYEAGKQLDKAEHAYLEVADKARFGFEKRDALDRAASLRLQKGNGVGAAELYERAMKTLPEDDTEERAIYQMRMAEATAGKPLPKSGS